MLSTDSTPRGPHGTNVPAVKVPSGSTAAAQQSLERLSQIAKNGVAATEEVDHLLAQLRQQDSAAVPLIADYLRHNSDLPVDLRLGLIQVLDEIGGAAALQAESEILAAALDPLEIAAIARSLESHAPAQYRSLILAVTQDALGTAMSAESPRGDVGPLFETLQAFGDSSAVTLLKQAVGLWNYYATLALGGLPDGAGIPALIELAKDPSVTSLGTGDIALRPLAQIAVQYPAAAEALVAQARSNEIPDTAWPGIIASVAGNYIQYGSQVFGSTAPPVNWSTSEINSRIGLLQQLLNVTSAPTARSALQSAITSLQGRLAAGG